MPLGGLDADRRHAALGSLARGILGERCPSDAGPRIAAALDRLPPTDRLQIGAVLRLLDHPVTSGALTGHPVPLSRAGPERAERFVRRWLGSRMGARRRFASAVVAAAMIEVYGRPGDHWTELGYSPPARPQASEPLLSPMQIDGDGVLECDVVVVGSGAGGSCAAAAIAQAGADVVVLERGSYLPEAALPAVEADAYARLYLYGGALATRDRSCRIVAGSTLGGGTVVNYSTALRPPPQVLQEWARRSRIEAFVSGELDDALDSVAARLGVTDTASAPGRRDRLLDAGLRDLGWRSLAVPRAVRGCPQDAACGSCGFGCPAGAKQSAARTFLPDAAGLGTRIVTGADAIRVVVRGGRARGVEARCGPHRLTVAARAVVAAAGAIETPALLLRSGVGGRVGRNLRLHPATAAWGLFDQQVRMWEGTLQARYSDELAAAGGHGPLLETAPLHPGAAAAAIPWTSPARHAAAMDRLAHAAICAVLPRDRGSGRVRIARDGSPVVSYRLSAADERALSDGLVAAGRVLEAAGAVSVSSPHRRGLSYRPSRPGDRDRWAGQVRAAGIRPPDLTLISFHQMGSCPIGAGRDAPVGPDFACRGVAGLYVADSSLFPSASGVNPMLTISALARLAAGSVVAGLP